MVPTATWSEHDAHGRYTRRWDAYDRGPDGRWGSPDDLRSGVEVVTRDDAGRVLQREQYRDRGPDGEWLTGDEAPTWNESRTYDPDGLLIHVSSTSILGAPRERRYEYGELGHLSQSVTINESGTTTTAYRAPRLAGPGDGVAETVDPYVAIGQR